jgi:uncharacterized membrane protein YciS (DUF1049 family)
MDGETTMNGNGRLHTKMPDVAGSVSELTHNVIELSELQARLLALDIKKSSRRTRTCLTLAIIGVCLLLGTMPVALLALAYLFVEQLGWSHAAALGVAALVGLVVAALVGGTAWGMVRSGLISLERSREELSRNIDWLKSTLRAHGQSAADKPRNY